MGDKYKDNLIAMMSLIDGAMEVVETWGETPYQKQWAREWVARAQRVMKEAGDDNVLVHG